ncbi:hypothetical protein DFH09DRAFT_1102891 [Mycena vulgaris]|nr:hypothetical protein DFH09DRAFT_1102891 [Mycena vulgaris]
MVECNVHNQSRCARLPGRARAAQKAGAAGALKRVDEPEQRVYTHNYGLHQDKGNGRSNWRRSSGTGARKERASGGGSGGTKTGNAAREEDGGAQRSTHHSRYCGCAGSRLVPYLLGQNGQHEEKVLTDEGQGEDGRRSWLRPALEKSREKRGEWVLRLNTVQSKGGSTARLLLVEFRGAVENSPSKEGTKQSVVAGGKHLSKGLDSRFGGGKPGVDVKKSPAAFFCTSTPGFPPPKRLFNPLERYLPALRYTRLCCPLLAWETPRSVCFVGHDAEDHDRTRKGGSIYADEHEIQFAQAVRSNTSRDAGAIKEEISDEIGHRKDRIHAGPGQWRVMTRRAGIWTRKRTSATPALDTVERRWRAA